MSRMSLDYRPRVLKRSANRLATFGCVTLQILGYSGIGSRAQTTAAPGQGTAPILVELFTSEGCSTCPPADAMLEEMDAQPIPGAQLIVLSEHVDYWDHDGWKDPYSTSAATERQNDYVRALSLNTAYTPQLIVDGNKELKRSDPQQIKQLFDKELSVGKISVRIASLSVGTKSPFLVRGRIEVDQNTEKQGADVFVVAALDHADSQVSGGENNGKHLTYVAVFQEIKRIAKLEKGKSVSQDFALKLKAGTDPRNVRIIAFVQDAGPGEVRGAAMQKISE